jgi:hypothetical protein
MTVSVNWDNHDHTILIYGLGNLWTWDELYASVDTGVGMVDVVEHDVDIIVDFQNCHKLPPEAFAQFNRVAGLATVKTQKLVLAGGGTFMLSLFNLFMLIVGSAGSKYLWVSDIDKARATILARRAGLVQ